MDFPLPVLFFCLGQTSRAMFSILLALHGEHLVVEVIAEVFIVTKFSKIIKKTFARDSGGFSRYVI
jgi:hypothetical protein